ncbi:hypothetical protein ZWY2020_048883 [Hordeum vulgare]|nr:hypothetical protein ZWY2020_048883 [Hordeum vulgare]
MIPFLSNIYNPFIRKKKSPAPSFAYDRRQGGETQPQKPSLTVAAEDAAEAAGGRRPRPRLRTTLRRHPRRRSRSSPRVLDLQAGFPEAADAEQDALTAPAVASHDFVLFFLLRYRVDNRLRFLPSESLEMMQLFWLEGTTTVL